MKAFADKIKDLRCEKGMTQTEIAKELGFRQSSIARWESGTQIPNIEVLIVFAKFFNVTADYLLGLESD